MFAALAAMLVPGAALAQDVRSQPQIDAVVRCLDIAAVEARVRCYDAAATALREGVRRGEIVARRSETPSRVEARVRSASASGGRWVVVLDNGQTWRTTENQRRRPPAVGAPILIRRNFVGSYWMRAGGPNEVRVSREQ